MRICAIVRSQTGTHNICWHNSMRWSEESRSTLRLVRKNWAEPLTSTRKRKVPNSPWIVENSGQFVERTEHLSPEDAPALFSALQEIKTLIRLADTRITAHFDLRAAGSLPELATALGKESPRVVMEDDHLVFHKSAFSFENTFMHLLRTHGSRHRNREVRQRKANLPKALST